LFFEYLKEGDYTLKIRAKAKGHYSWSEPVTYNFSMYKVWYTRPEIIISINLLFLFLVYLYVRYRQAKNTKEKLKLEAIIADRTKDLKNQNKELIVAKEKVEEAIKTKDKFFSILGHDLSSPFNALIGYSKLLVENPQIFDEEKKTQIYKDILKTSENTHKLLRNLLDWSLSQTGKLSIRKEHINFNNFLTEILPTLEAAAKQKGISLEVEITEEITILVDKAMVATILRNLVSNAIKFSNPNSKILISAHMDNSFGYISVTDYGVGMPEESVKNLFALDKNISTLGTNNEKGTGLGLVLCKEFATLSKGDIFVESELNIGSTFTLRVPS
jgi:signal transduction histidine kinase